MCDAGPSSGTIYVLADPRIREGSRLLDIDQAFRGAQQLNVDAADMLHGSFAVSVAKGVGPLHSAKYAGFLERWEAHGNLGEQVAPDAFAPFAYDAVVAIALALDAISQKQPNGDISGDQLQQALMDLEFVGSTGLFGGVWRKGRCLRCFPPSLLAVDVLCRSAH